MPSEKPTAVARAVSRTTRAWCAPGAATAGAGVSTCQAPSIFRWVCRVHRSGPRSMRVSRCLPRETVSTTVPPLRSAVACWGTRKSVSVQPLAAQRAVQQPGGAPDGVALRHRHDLSRSPGASRRSRPRRAPRAAGSSRRRAAARRRPSRPSAGRASRAGPPRPATRSPGRAGRRRRSRSAGCGRRARRRGPASPSTRTTRAPALRPGRCPPDRPAVGPGERRAVGVGRVGGGQRDRGRLARRRSTSAKVRSRSIAPAVPNWAAPSPLDEVAAAAAAGVLERREHLVDRRRSRRACRSLTTAPRITTPCRSSSRSAVACARRVGSVSSCGQQRPAAGGLGRPGAQRRAAAAGGRGHAGPGGGRRVRWLGVPDRVSARSGVRVSLLIRPAQTRSHRAARGPRRRSSRPLRRAGGRTTRRPEPARRGRPGGARRARTGSCSGQGQRRLVGEVQRDPAVGAGQRGVAGPDHLAGGGELVEVATARSRAPGRPAPAAPGREAGTGQPASWSIDRRARRRRRGACAGRRAARRAGTGRARPAGPARPPCAAGPASGGAASAAPRRRTTPSRSRPGRNSPSSTRPWAAEPLQGLPDDGGAEPEPGGDVVGGERAVGAGVAGDQVGERVVDGLGERVGGARRHGDAEPVAQPADVLDRGPALVAGDPDLDDPAGVAPARRASAPRRRRRRRTRSLTSCGGERAEQPEQVGDALGVAGPAVGGEPLQLGLDLGQHLGVEQLAQLGPAEQLGEQALVERERGGPALGDGGVALVDELGDVPEEQAARERRRAAWVATSTTWTSRRSTRASAPTSAGRS